MIMFNYSTRGWDKLHESTMRSTRNTAFFNVFIRKNKNMCILFWSDPCVLMFPAWWSLLLQCHWFILNDTIICIFVAQSVWKMSLHSCGRFIWSESDSQRSLWPSGNFTWDFSLCAMCRVSLRKNNKDPWSLFKLRAGALSPGTSCSISSSQTVTVVIKNVVTT